MNNAAHELQTEEVMVLQPAAWAVLILGAIVVVWFSMRDDDPPEP